MQRFCFFNLGKCGKNHIGLKHREGPILFQLWDSVSSTVLLSTKRTEQLSGLEEKDWKKISCLSSASQFYLLAFLAHYSLLVYFPVADILPSHLRRGARPGSNRLSLLMMIYVDCVRTESSPQIQHYEANEPICQLPEPGRDSGASSLISVIQKNAPSVWVCAASFCQTWEAFRSLLLSSAGLLGQVVVKSFQILNSWLCGVPSDSFVWCFLSSGTRSLQTS